MKIHLNYFVQNGPYPEDFKEGILSEKLKEDMEAYYAPLLESYIQALEDLGFPLEVREALVSLLFTNCLKHLNFKLI